MKPILMAMIACAPAAAQTAADADALERHRAELEACFVDAKEHGGTQRSYKECADKVDAKYCGGPCK